MPNETTIYHCTHCGARNRLAITNIRNNPNCGKCKKAMFPNMPIRGTDAVFNMEVEQCPIPVLVDFWAPWCGPCKMVAPMLNDIAPALAGRIKIVKVNVDENPQSSARFHVRSIPTMLLFHHGAVKETMTGALSKHDLLARLQAYSCNESN